MKFLKGSILFLVFLNCFKAFSENDLALLVSDSILISHGVDLKKLNVHSSIRAIRSHNPYEDLNQCNVRYPDTLIKLISGSASNYCVTYTFDLGDFKSRKFSAVFGFSESNQLKFAFYNQFSFLILKNLFPGKDMHTNLTLKNLESKIEFSGEINIDSIAVFENGLSGYVDCTDRLIGKTTRFYFQCQLMEEYFSNEGFPVFSRYGVTNDYLKDLNELIDVDPFIPVVVFQTRPVALQEGTEESYGKHLIVLDLNINYIQFDSLVSTYSGLISDDW